MPPPDAMHHLIRRAHPLRVALHAALTIALLAPAGHGLGASPAPAPAAAPLALQASSRTKARARTQTKRPARRTMRRTRARAATPVVSIAWTSPNGLPALTADLSRMISTKIRSGRFGVMVASLTRGDTLFAQNAGEMMQPASTMKLMSTAVALDRFGPEHCFSTDVLRDAPIGGDGTITGNIYLHADGDPSMSARFYHDANLPMATLARSVAAAGVKHVKGDLVFDASAFDDHRIPDGWKTTYLGAAYAARVSALSLNENIVWVVVQPAGKQASVTLEPMTTTIPIRSKVRLVGGRGGRIVARRAADGGIDVSGSIGSSSGPLRYSLVVDDPALFTAGALRAALQAAGVTVDGAVKPGKTPASAEKVASLASPPLSRIVSEMNRESINIVAELLFRDAARTSSDGIGTAETGLTNLRDFMQKKVGADPQQIRVSDGSGLSTLDFMTPRAMIHLLGYAHQGPWSSAFHGSLPVAGESELLRRRMRSTPAQGNLHAKTGTTNTVVSLAGYVTARNGEILAFSFIYNGNDRWNAKATIDAMGATLANFVRE
ncbi:MAG: D-alanyl-D-alanine carboxypeptidase/D-alanyl-D-alanine-endopeptidase [Gemmatimonadaceae bacterium]